MYEQCSFHSNRFSNVAFLLLKYRHFFVGHLEIFKRSTVSKLGHEVASCLKKLILLYYLSQLENLTPTPMDEAIYLKTLHALAVQVRLSFSLFPLVFILKTLIYD